MRNNSDQHQHQHNHNQVLIRQPDGSQIIFALAQLSILYTLRRVLTPPLTQSRAPQRSTATYRVHYQTAPTVHIHEQPKSTCLHNTAAHRPRQRVQAFQHPLLVIDPNSFRLPFQTVKRVSINVLACNRASSNDLFTDGWPSWFSLWWFVALRGFKLYEYTIIKAYEYSLQLLHLFYCTFCLQKSQRIERFILDWGKILIWLQMKIIVF